MWGGVCHIEEAGPGGEGGQGEGRRGRQGERESGWALSFLFAWHMYSMHRPAYSQLVSLPSHASI